MPRLTRPGAALAAAALAAVLASGTARAADAIPLGSDAPDHTFARAGNPCAVSRLARPGRTPDYCGYYVGGGCAVRGGPPGPLQGVFGYDYCQGPCVSHHVVLGFCYGCRPKGGIGAYKTDGPHVPNVLGVKLPERASPECCSAH